MAELLGKLTAAMGTYGPAVLFYGVAGLVLASAAYAVVAKKIDHSAFSLMACFTGVAALYAMLGSDFLAVTQVIVYVGGIMILIVFGVLLTDRLPVEYRQISRETVVQGLAVAVPVMAALVWAAAGTSWPVVAEAAAAAAPPAAGGTDPGTTAAIGKLLLTDYLFPFEFASVLLLVALVGAARMARGGAK
ncbi:MAG: NADH-quinone oxidoreductase subunit J [Planctomycetes bacterium]|nr:NADH-quinone oxidoreductase subunit J [Planctomycetota bacterium]